MATSLHRRRNDGEHGTELLVVGMFTFLSARVVTDPGFRRSAPAAVSQGVIQMLCGSMSFRV